MYRRLVLLLSSCLCALAQDVSGNIAGNVLDPHGAGVPHAKVFVIHSERNQVVRTLTTDSGGNYSAPLIPIGVYDIKVEAAGFKTETIAGITVNVSDDLKINVKLMVGAVTEQITVMESASAVELGSPAISTTIDGAQVRETPLSTRNYEQLLILAPGVSANQTDELFIGATTPVGTATIPYAVNGQRTSANGWTVDGSDNIDRGSNQTLLTFPSVDSIAEFKLSRSAYTADSGRAGGAQINVVTKSGTNRYHGSAFEFIRNNAFAANNWLNNANSVLVNGKVQVPPIRWNDFGFTFGGPIRRNKTFFFYSQEMRRIITYVTYTPILPTTAQLGGTFTSPVCTSFTGTTGTTCASTGTQITNINPISAAYIKDIYSKLPLPAPGASNTVFVPQRAINNANQELVKIDHQFSQKFSIWGKFHDDSIPTVEPGGLFSCSSMPFGCVTHTNAPGRGIILHAQNTFRPNLLNESGFNFSRGAILSTPAGLTSKANAPDINVNLPFPNVQGVVTGISLNGFGTTLNGYGPYNDYNRNYAFLDNLTWLKGRHTMKFGFTMNHYNKTENLVNGGTQGTLTFSSTGVPSGTSSFQQAWANFLLGGPVATFTQNSIDITPNLWVWQHEAYAQDDFRVSPRFTLSYGVRWSYFGQPVDNNGKLDNFDPGTYLASQAPQIDPVSGNKIANTGNATNGLIYAGKNSPFGDNVSNSNWKDFAPRIGIAWDPFGYGRTSLRAGYGVYFDSTLFGTFEQNIGLNPPYNQSINISNTNINNPGGGTVNVSLSPVVLRATPVPTRTPYTQHWNVTIQHQLQRTLIVEVGYAGSKGTHLLGIVDLNEAPPGLAAAAGLGSQFTTTTEPKINAVRPYLGYNAINVVESAFDSNYHSLQASFKKNFGASGFFGISYTFSKNLSDNGSDRSNAPQNSYNWHEGEYAPAALDRRQIFTVYYAYTVPVFKHSRGFTVTALKGWEISGLTTYQTGLPTTATTSGVDPAGLGLLGSSTASARPDLVCDPSANAPRQVGAASELKAVWFNTGCFATVPAPLIRPGDEGRYVIRMPGTENFDFTLHKNFQIKERFKLDLRGETFNTLNHPNPSGFGSLTVGNSQFGKITSFRAPRRIQLGVKLYF